ncbi:MAG: M28 family peptidase [Bacteroidia bacterium]|nr:M28 family peptidase [Bacteroidia bacterium]
MVAVITITAGIGCKSPQKPEQQGATAPNTAAAASAMDAFSATQAYTFIKDQVDFGPRVPGTEAHDKCLQFLVDRLKSDSLKVVVQRSSAKTYDGKKYDFENIIASSDPGNPSRVLICGHWDSRPFADQDSVDPEKPFDAADDGGSSAAVMLELGRVLKKYPAHIGVDLVFFDLEDYGQQTDDNYPHMEDSWCLGSQYWAKNLPQGYNPRYGILLDMVGGKNAAFPMEGTSLYYAPDVVHKIWNIASDIGYGAFFTHDKTGQTTDDHLYVNKIANIPTIDIVDYHVESGDYPYWHHKHSDNMSIIDSNTLKMVGRVLVKTIYSENSTATP